MPEEDFGKILAKFNAEGNTTLILNALWGKDFVANNEVSYESKDLFNFSLHCD